MKRFQSQNPTEREMNRQVVIVATVALIVLVLGAIILSSSGVDLFGMAVLTPTP